MTRHDRPTLKMMLRPGRQSREMRDAINREIERLLEREDKLALSLGSAQTHFAASLTVESIERVHQRREVLLNRLHPTAHGKAPRHQERLWKELQRS